VLLPAGYRPPGTAAEADRDVSPTAATAIKMRRRHRLGVGREFQLSF